MTARSAVWARRIFAPGEHAEVVVGCPEELDVELERLGDPERLGHSGGDVVELGRELARARGSSLGVNNTRKCSVRSSSRPSSSAPPYISPVESRNSATSGAAASTTHPTSPARTTVSPPAPAAVRWRPGPPNNTPDAATARPAAVRVPQGGTEGVAGDDPGELEGADGAGARHPRPQRRPHRARAHRHPRTRTPGAPTRGPRSTTGASPAARPVYAETSMVACLDGDGPGRTTAPPAAP
jgi:hypothetical protein